MNHELKCHPAMFRAVRDGRKPFEVRKDDRAFQAGDTIELKYFDPDVPDYPNMPMQFSPWAQMEDKDDKKPLTRRITFVLRGGQYGIEAGYVVLGLETV